MTPSPTKPAVGSVMVEIKEPVVFEAIQLHDDLDTVELVRFLVKYARSWSVSSAPYSLKLLVNGYLIKGGTWLVAKGAEIERLTPGEFSKAYRVPAQPKTDPWAGMEAQQLPRVASFDPVAEGALIIGEVAQCPDCSHSSKSHSPGGCWAAVDMPGTRCDCRRQGVSSTDTARRHAGTA